MRPYQSFHDLAPQQLMEGETENELKLRYALTMLADMLNKARVIEAALNYEVENGGETGEALLYAALQNFTDDCVKLRRNAQRLRLGAVADWRDGWFDVDSIENDETLAEIGGPIILNPAENVGGC